MLTTVSLLEPSGRFTGENMTLGGLAVTPLKKLNGARFAMPLLEMVDTHAIGRGTIVETIVW
jgi:hypothetical protein